MTGTTKQIVQNSNSNFSIAFIGLPKDQRRALEAVYSYCRVVDDIADESSSVEEAAKGLQEWRNALASNFKQSTLLTSPFVDELVWTLRQYPALQPDLLWILDGVEKDLEKKRYTTLEELLDYCDAVASAVGFCCMTIFGVDRDASKKYVYATGRALQLTNIIRDVAVDAKKDRIYLPKTYLMEFGLTENEILLSQYDGGFIRMVESFASAIDHLYQESETEAQSLPTHKIWPAEVMRRTYLGIFNKIREKKYNVFSKKIGLSKVQKAWIILSQPRS